jgi:hypothetical protein
MQHAIDGFENHDPEEFEPEDTVAELCAAPRMPHKVNKKGRDIVPNLMDRVKREEARKTATLQDSKQQHIESTRYDVNSYAGGPATIPDVCVIEKRKRR